MQLERDVAGLVYMQGAVPYAASQVASTEASESAPWIETTESS